MKESKIRLVIDFDGTIVPYCFPRIDGVNNIGGITALKYLDSLGIFSLNLFTMRSDFKGNNFLNDALEFCEKQGVVFDNVNVDLKQAKWTDSPKMYGQLYIDDAAAGSPLLSIEKLAEGRPFIDWVRILNILDDKFKIKAINPESYENAIAEIKEAINFLVKKYK